MPSKTSATFWRSSSEVRRWWFWTFIAMVAAMLSLAYFLLGGHLKVAKQDASAMTVSDGQLLLERNHQFTRTELEHLGTLTGVTDLNLVGTNINDASMEFIGVLKDVESVNLSGCDISDDGLSHLSSLRRLVTLSLNDTNVTDSGLAHLKPLSNLETMSLVNTRVEGPGFVELRDLPKLRTVMLAGSLVGNGTAEAVAALPHLESVLLVDSKITDKGVLSLQNAKALQHLSLARSRVSDSGVVALVGMKKLKYLELTGNSSITDKALQHLSQVGTLEGLLLAETQVTDTGIERLFNLRLTRLDLRGTAVTAEMVASIRTRSPHCLVLHSSIQGDEERDAVLGRHIADFSLPTLNGDTFKLSEFRGRVLVVYFWATWCKSCVQSTESQKEMYGELMEQHPDFTPISFSVDDAASQANSYVEKHSLDWLNAWVGPYSDVAAQFGLRGGGAGYFFVIDRDGKVVARPTNLGQMREEALKVLGQ